MRAHLDVGEGIELRALEALLALREEWRGVIDIELAAMADLTITGADGARARAWLESALESGADVVGGAPGLDPDPAAAVDVLLSIAAAAGRPLDLHVDETLDPAAGVLATLSRVVVETGFDRPVTASHCASLGMLSEREQRELAAAVAAAGIAVVALPATNLYLLGRDRPTARPRGITALGPLVEAGVVVAAGVDNVNDHFNPLGTLDPLRTVELLVLAGHTSLDVALRSVTDAARRALRLPALAVEPGSPADLVALASPTLERAISETGEDRIVFKAGHLVAQTSVIQTVSPGAVLRKEAPV
jgi:cytosine deaminase